MHKPTASDADSIRLNRFLAQLGVASRRACDALIAAGRVRVDGRVVKEPGTRVNPGESSIEFDGARLGRPPKRVVLILNKPKGFVSTVTDPEGRPTVLDLCGPLGKRQRLFPVGRLDVNTTGALLMTNDGFLCFRLTHPRFGIARVYQVRVRGQLDEARVRRLEKMAASEARVARTTKPEPGKRQAPKAAAGGGSGGTPGKRGGAARDTSGRTQPPGAAHVRGGGTARGGAQAPELRLHLGAQDARRRGA